MPAEQQTLTIRAYRPGDEAAVLELFQRAFGVSRGLAQWRWKFEQNPCGREHISLAFDADGRLVGHFAGYPVPFRHRGRDVLGHQMGDVMTDPSVRHLGRGPTSVFVRCMLHFYETFSEGQVAFNYGFNVGNVQKLFLRYLRGQVVEPVAYRVRNLKTDPMRTVLWARRLRGYQFEHVQKLTDEWDELFERTWADYGFLTRRDRSYVQWRYLDCPEVPYVVVAVRRWRRLVGWIVFRIREDRFSLGDALFDRRHPDAVEMALRHVVPQYPVNLVEGWFPPRPDWFAGILDRLGLARRDEPQGLSMIAASFTDPGAVEHLRGSYYTMGDGDLF